MAGNFSAEIEEAKLEEKYYYCFLASFIHYVYFCLSDFDYFFDSRASFMSYVGSNSELAGYYYPPLTVDPADADIATNRRVGGKLRLILTVHCSLI